MPEHVIRTARKAKGLSAGALAAVTPGVSASTIYAIEQGRSIGSVRTMFSLANSLSLSPSELIEFAFDATQAPLST
jgi:transcriptional regulator with XRE-family HTH domain